MLLPSFIFILGVCLCSRRLYSDQVLGVRDVMGESKGNQSDDKQQARIPLGLFPIVGEAFISVPDP